MAKTSSKTKSKQDEQDQQHTRGASRIGAFRDELAVDYLKCRDLEKDGTEFTVLDAFERQNSRFGKQELVLEIVTADGESGFITLAHSPRRLKFLKLVKSRGPIGPLIVVKGKDESQGNAAWCFADPSDPEDMF